MVIAAKVENNHTYFLITQGDLGMTIKKRIVKQNNILSKENGIVVGYEGVLIIPEDRVGDFNIADFINYKVKDANIYLKDLVPDKEFDLKELSGNIGVDIGTWIQYKSRGYCKSIILRNKNGNWGLNGEIIKYEWKKPIYVLRSNSKRHKLEEEYETLIIHLDTGECEYNSRLYNSPDIYNRSYKFCKKYGVWLSDKVFKEKDIIAIRR